MNLEKFAYFICGPRDFILNLAINTAIPWYLTRKLEYISVLGNPSLFSLFIPMGLLLVGFTSFFGFFNGITGGKVNKKVLIDKFPNYWTKL